MSASRTLDVGRHDLTTRADIVTLLSVFYGRALHDELLEPVFAAAGMDMATHLPRIASFWEVSLLGSGEYAGRPMQVHQRLTEKAGLRQEHFQRWLALWDTAVAEMFEGPTADRARRDAPRMATGMLNAFARAATRAVPGPVVSLPFAAGPC